MKKILIIGALLLTGACGRKAKFVEEGSQTCTIVESTMMCPDGTEYDLPDTDDIAVIVEDTPDYVTIVVETEPANEEDPGAICERSNKNGRKCKKIKKEKK